MMGWTPGPVIVSQGFATVVLFEFLLAGWILGYVSCLAIKAHIRRPAEPPESAADKKAREYHERGYGWRDGAEVPGPRVDVLSVPVRGDD